MWVVAVVVVGGGGGVKEGVVWRKGWVAPACAYNVCTLLHSVSTAVPATPSELLLTPHVWRPVTGIGTCPVTGIGTCRVTGIRTCIVRFAASVCLFVVTIIADTSCFASSLCTCTSACASSTAFLAALPDEAIQQSRGRSEPIPKREDSQKERAWAVRWLSGRGMVCRRPAHFFRFIFKLQALLLEQSRRLCQLLPRPLGCGSEVICNPRSSKQQIASSK